MATKKVTVKTPATGENPEFDKAWQEYSSNAKGKFMGRGLYYEYWLKQQEKQPEPEPASETEPGSTVTKDDSGSTETKAESLQPAQPSEPKSGARRWLAIAAVAVAIVIVVVLIRRKPKGKK